MRGAIKFIMTAIGLMLITIAVAVILLSSPLRDLARQRLSGALAAHYGADVSIDAIRLAPLEYGIEIRGLTIFNPEPFAREPAIECERILLRADLATLFSPEPVFSSVEIEAPKVHLRYDLGKGSNLMSLVKNAEEAEAKAAPARRSVVIQNCSATGAKVTLTSNAVLGVPFPINLAPFKLKEVSAENPVSGWKMSRIFLKTLLMETVTMKGLLSPVAEKIRSEFGNTPKTEE